MNDKDNLPPLPNVSLPPIPVDLINEESDETVKKAVSPKKKNSTPELSFKPRLMLTLFSFLVCLLSVVLIFKAMVFSKEMIYRFDNLDESSRLTLQQTLNRSIDKGLVISVKKMAKKEAFWLGTNFRFSGEVFASFKSVPGKILGHDEVAFDSSSKLNDGIAMFSVMKMNSGLKIIPGIYSYEITLYPSGYKYRLHKKLAEFGLNKNPDEYLLKKIKGEVVFFGGGERAFKKQLKSFQEATEKRFISPLQERIGRYETFLQLLNRTQKHFEEALEKSKKAKDMELFEDLYNQNVGPFLTDLITDANRLHLSYLNVSPERSKAYEKLFILGKKIGGVASDMATESKKMNMKKKDEFKNRFQVVVKDLIEEINTEKLLIQSELKKYQ